MHNNKEDEVEEEVGSSPEVRFSGLFQGFRLRERANEWFSSRSLTSRHTPLSERLEQPCLGTTLMGSSLVSFRGFYPTRPPPSRRRLLQQGCAWNRLRFLESPGSFLDPKQTFKSKSLLTGSFKVILCAKLLKPQLFGIFQKQAPGGCFSKVLVLIIYMWQTGRFVTKQGHFQARFCSKVRALSTQL